MKLKNRLIYISGSSKRIGRSLALAIAKEGADLIIHHNQSQKEAESLKNEIETLGQKAFVVQSDYSDPMSTQKHAETIFREYSVSDVINNASLFTNTGWYDTDLDNWQKHIDINLTAPFLLCQSFAKSLSAKTNGRIVNMLDWRSLRPGIDHLPYTISKSGLFALTQSLAQSLAPNITVNGIALGAILPPAENGGFDQIIERLPNPRWGKMEEVEDTVKFLLTGPEYITGEVIHLDGGRHLV